MSNGRRRRGIMRKEKARDRRGLFGMVAMGLGVSRSNRLSYIAKFQIFTSMTPL